MNIERAIELAGNWANGMVNSLAPNELKEYHAAALAAMREKKERLDNPLLTKEDLLKMDGKPVWIEYRSDGDEAPPAFWALVSVDEDFGEIYLQNSIAGSASYEEAFMDIDGIYKFERE